MSTYRRQPLWYKDAIIYELNIKGFYDSNRDGIGDFAGLEQKLDYIEDLGVTAIWLLPFYPSPLRDDGYDISDYYHIREAYGSIDDFKRFLDAAHARGLQVITELVINHTSDQHPWFQAARRAPKGSPEREMYVWSDTDRKYEDVRIIFTDTETSNWTWDPVAEQYYWHRFFHHQPDLNYDNPQVQKEIFTILDYWMEMGIDGFRLDAIPYLFEREGTNGENLPETHDFLKKLRKHVDDNYDNVLFLAEANMWPEDSASYFGDGDECHMNYHFPLMPRLYMSVKMEDRHPITDIFEQTPEIPANCQWATFLRNHDELTLEMVTDEERDFMYKVYASDKKARINLGIRRRLAPLMDNDRNKIELLNILLLSLPGTPVLYYGDEIGMGDNYYLKDRDGVRTPMQWNNNENAGFSEANPHSLYLPVIRDTEYSYRWVNVKRQEENPNSLLNWTRKILAKRRSFTVFGRGSIEWLAPENSHILSFIRAYEEEKVLVVVNLSRHPQSLQLDLSAYQGMQIREVFGRTFFSDITKDPYPLTIDGHGYYWLELEAVASGQKDVRKLAHPMLTLSSFKQLFARPQLKALESKILLNYFRSVSWMAEKRDLLEKVDILEHRLHFNNRRHFGWLFCRLIYKDAQPEHVQLPIAIHNFRPELNYGDNDAAICKVGRTDSEKEYLLVDAIYDDEYRTALLDGLDEFNCPDQIIFTPSPELKDAKGQEVTIEKSSAEYIHLQAKDFSIKYFRRVDITPLPDLEVKQVLNANNFAAAPKISGTLRFMQKDRYDTTLAIYEQRMQVSGVASEVTFNQFQLLGEAVETKLRQGDTLNAEDIQLTDDVSIEQIPDVIQASFGPNFISRITEIAECTAAFHRLLAQEKGTEFKLEALSLHYQRSLYASHKGQIRSTLSQLKKALPQLSEVDQESARQLLAQEELIHRKLKRVFRHKIEADKIRIHGDYTLEQLHLQDEGFIIRNFDGDPDLEYTQRKLRRSPAKDIANLLRSINYAAELAAQEHASVSIENQQQVRQWMGIGHQYLAATFLTAYRRATADHPRLLPANEEDCEVLLTTFMIEKALQEIRYDLNYRMGQVGIGVRGLLGLLA